MIRIENLSKSFDAVNALSDISFDVPEGSIFGLLGTNGAGKSTLLKIMSGILKADSGTIMLDGADYTADTDVKKNFFYLPDDPYYFPNATIEDMARFYRQHYPDMSIDSVCLMAGKLDLETQRPLRTFSKGMKRQAFLIMALCAGTKYLLCDEVFDGLDPVITEAMKDLFLKELKERCLTVVVAAHKLMDLEDICRNIAILHKGGILLSGDMKERAGAICKIQCVSDRDLEQPLNSSLDVLKFQKEYNFITLIAKGDPQEILGVIKTFDPIFCGEVPMTLEEIFMVQMEVNGYDIQKVLQ